MSGLPPRPSTAPVRGTDYTCTIEDSGNSNMKVVVRIRPESEAEISSSAASVTRMLDSHVLVFDPQPENIPSFHALQKPLNPFKKRGPLLGKKHKDLRFAFDRVFDETSTQVEVFEESTKNIVESVLDGINCSVFAYGATGAGKTHTMLGSPDSPGVMFHTMMELYHCISELSDTKTFEVAVSYCEVYNESIRDLLGSALDGGSLELREDSKQGLVVSNLSKHQPKTAAEVLSMLERGNMNRTQHPTDANATSSRSHAVFQVYVHQKPRTAAISTQMTCAKLSLIDLAGSERATVTTNRGARLREGANINKSLLALGNCINALTENRAKSVHIPYRNSKLTRLLKDSLGGNCRTVMIANISPSSLTYEDTYNTLKYADRAKQIKTKVVRNVLNVDFHVSRYRVIVQELQKEIAELKNRLESKASGKKTAGDSNDSTRLQDLVRGVYGERSRLRKHMVDLDTQERETLLRICRKERDLHRIDTLTGNEVKKAKLAAKVSALQQQIVETERQKQMVHEYLFSNNEAVTRVQKEVKTATANAPGLHELMREVVEGRKMATENAHHWRQTKHLLRYVKAQEREIGKTERLLLLALEVARKQHTLLVAYNALTPSLRDMFSNLVHTAEGEKGVAWADQSATGEVLQAEIGVGVGGVEHSSLSVCQQALFDTFLVHASPARRLSLDKHSPANLSKPLTGILSNGSTNTNTGTAHEGRGSGSVCGAVDSGICEPCPSDTSSAVSSMLSSRVSSIPDKPRMPTPIIDDLSSSCSSTNSLYDTRLNTVINSYHQKPTPTVLRGGRYTRLPTSRSCTPTAYDSPLGDTPRGTPEPYLTPIPSLHKLKLTRQNSGGIGQQSYGPPAHSDKTTDPVPLSRTSSINSTTGPPSRVVHSSIDAKSVCGGSSKDKPSTTPTSMPAFTKLKSSTTHPPATPQTSSDFATQLVSKMTKLKSTPIPLPRVRTKPSQILPPPSSPVTWNRFDDNFVSVPNAYTPLPTRTPPQVPPRINRPTIPRSSCSPDEVATACDGVERSKDNCVVLSQESSASSHASSNTVRSAELNQPHQTLHCKPYPANTPFVTVQTHSTVVRVHSPSSQNGVIPAKHHSVTVGVNHTHKGEELARPRPPAFVPPPPFESIHNRHTHTVSTTTKCSSAVSSDPSKRGLVFTDRDASVMKMEPNLNSTFTVAASKSHHRSAHPACPQHSGTASSSVGGGSSGGKSRPNGVSFKPVPGALKALYVNSPRALNERPRDNATAETDKTRKSRGLPSYLQLTKSAASKRVIKLQNKENGMNQAKKPGRGRAFRTVNVAQPVC